MDTNTWDGDMYIKRTRAEQFQRDLTRTMCELTELVEQATSLGLDPSSIARFNQAVTKVQEAGVTLHISADPALRLVRAS